jgi:hypothetical protein
MATDYQSLLDMLNPKKEEEQLFSPVNPTPEQLASIQEQQAMQQPESMAEMPVQPVVKTAPAAPKQDQPKAPAQDDLPNPPAGDTPLSKSEALIAEYNKMLGRDQEALAEARKTDRMLKVGGALGDALATYLNAKSQMNVKAPGVQVQQGAGLDKVAEMFATAPGIQSDIAARRENLMKQYAELAKGERAQTRLTSEEQRAKAADLRARELAQMQIEGDLKAAAIKASRKGEPTPYQEMMKEEKQAQKQEKDLKALKEVETRKRTIEDNIERAKSIISKYGTFEMTGPQSEELNSIIDEISVDMAKLQDPDSVARPNEVALVRKNLVPEGVLGKLGMSNKTAINLLEKFKNRVEERAKTAYQVRGIKAPTGEEAVKSNQMKNQETKKEQTQNIESRIEKVLKANPRATRQQVIDALKKDEKLPADYK